MQREVFRLVDRVNKTDMAFKSEVIEALQALVDGAEIDYAAILKQVNGLLEAA